MQTEVNKTLVVIGGGAAGFFCAINTASATPNLKVIIIEKNNKLLSKVRVSGGGRCNVTHSCFDMVELSKKYPRGEAFLKKAFHWFNTTDTINWFKQKGVELKTETDGRMFPESNTSQTIIDCLIQEANKHKIEILLSNDVAAITKTNQLFNIQFHHSAKIIVANYVCVACGGFPKISQFDWLANLGHTIQNPVPSLFTFNIPNNKIVKLMGLSVDKATVKIVGSKLQSSGALLITHWGLSGPAVLKLSAFAALYLANKNYNFEILVNWLNQYNEQSLKEEFWVLRQQLSSQKIHTKNPFGLPSRLWEYLLLEAEISENTRWADLLAKQQNNLIKNLTAQQFFVKGKTIFKEEFVTCGGIKLSEVDVNTMQSKKVENLFFAGEILDIDGITGGFNFQNAWTTGFIAAKGIVNNSLNAV
jgi:predicted Rossmann fold flavoprotein